MTGLSQLCRCLRGEINDGRCHSFEIIEDRQAAMQTVADQHTQTNYTTLLRRSSTALMIAVWSSAFIFGLYILSYYIGAIPVGELPRWNIGEGKSTLYAPRNPGATAGIGVHFLAGGIIVMLGNIQLLVGVRKRFPTLHRWVGRLYIGGALLTAVGGLLFIAISGTVGGRVMDIGFTLYGLLMGLAAVEAVRHAMTGRFDQHQAWAWRLYALVVASWLYRIEYVSWALFFGETGRTDDFQGIFDYIMSFFFYLPNLLIVELMLRLRTRIPSPPMTLVASAIFILATVLVILSTLAYTLVHWGPNILASLVTL